MQFRLFCKNKNTCISLILIFKENRFIDIFALCFMSLYKFLYSHILILDQLSNLNTHIEQHTHKTILIITIIINKVNVYYKQCSAVNIN